MTWYEYLSLPPVPALCSFARPMSRFGLPALRLVLSIP
jgi:hypothetical protein